MTDSALASRLARLKLMAFDVDGVLTDGRLWYGDDGSEIKVFDARDGHGMKMLREAGLKLAIITGRRSAVVDRRARELGVHYCFQGVEAKLPTFIELLSELQIEIDDAGYMGDDLLDLSIMTRAGFAATVPEAPESVSSRAHYVSRHPGGRGAVREVCEQILTARGVLDAITAEYLK